MFQPLQPEAVKNHWREFRPKMYEGLQKKGLLNQAVHNAIERTKEMYGQLIEQGMSPDQAREATREQWAFLPAESDLPNLPETKLKELTHAPEPEQTTA